MGRLLLAIVGSAIAAALAVFAGISSIFLTFFLFMMMLVGGHSGAGVGVALLMAVGPFLLLPASVAALMSSAAILTPLHFFLRNYKMSGPAWYLAAGLFAGFVIGSLQALLPLHHGTIIIKCFFIGACMFGGAVEGLVFRLIMTGMKPDRMPMKARPS
jgi:hypothetical protein